MRSKKGKELDFNVKVIEMFEDYNDIGRIICLRDRLIHIINKEFNNRCSQIDTEDNYDPEDDYEEDDNDERYYNADYDELEF